MSEVLQQLQKAILQLQGCKAPSSSEAVNLKLPALESAFPHSVFPTAAMHEFHSVSPKGFAATNGFVSAVLGTLMQKGGACIWVTTNLNLFPQALSLFGIEPHRIIFIQPKKEKDLLWCMEEALKCERLAAVVGEIKNIDFTASRRLQLAVKQSRVTGFLLRHQPRQLNTIATVTRWAITPLPSSLEDGMPGVGFPRWRVELQKVRNGKAGTWNVEWSNNGFQLIEEQKAFSVTHNPMRKTG